MIIGYVKGQELKITQPVIVADTIDYLTALFTFSTADWLNTEKWAHLKQGEMVYDVMLTDDKILKTDHLNLADGEWEIYLHGNRFVDGEVTERITTEVVKITVGKSGVLNGEPLPEIPATEAERINAKLADHEKRIDYLEEHGGGGGGSNEVWLPTVDDNGNISWVKSSSETAPATKNIKGERGNDGADGYTPVRGTDYWTAEDVAAIESYIDNKLGVIENGSY